MQNTQRIPPITNFNSYKHKCTLVTSCFKSPKHQINEMIPKRYNKHLNTQPILDSFQYIIKIYGRKHDYILVISSLQTHVIMLTSNNKYDHKYHNKLTTNVKK